MLATFGFRRTGTLRRKIGKIAALVLAALVLQISAGIPAHAAAKKSIQAVDKKHLRVCADPGTMPYSNEKEEGFENKIAQLLADKLGIPLVYTWLLQKSGFIRKTLNAKRCDLIIGINAGNANVLNTNPYYRTSYAMVVPRDSGIEARRIGDPEMAHLRIGAVAGTPPNHLLAMHRLLSRVRSYRRVVSTHGEDMIRDLKNGIIDVALLYGPTAAYELKQQGLDAEMIPLESTGRGQGRMDFFITMGVRKNEKDWKHTINAFLKENQEEITAILEDYGVPLLEIRTPRRSRKKNP